MGFQNIEKKDFWYTFLLNALVSKWFNHVFYRKVIVNYAERIPKEGLLIFTPNHQNALIDAMAPLCNIDKQLVFLARSDIFKKKAIAKILYFLKILPIFRIRDGYGEVKKNDAIFSKTIDVLNAGNGLVLFPEGSHVPKHQLRSFKKGHARIAFQTAEASDFNVDLKIVPVGINYSDYKRMRSDITLTIGHPILVSEFYELYKESPAIAINILNKKLYEHLSPVMLNIENEEDYEMINFLASFYKEEMSKKLGFKNNVGLNAFTSQKKIISLLERENEEKPKSYAEIKSSYFNYWDLLKRTKPNFDFPEQGELSFMNLFHNTFIVLLGFPLFVYGLFNNIIPLLITLFFRKKIKDETFKSSFAFVISLLIFPIFYLIQLILVIIFVNQWWIWLLYALSLPFSAAYSLDYSTYFRRFKQKLHWLLVKLGNKTAYQALRTARQKLVALLNNLEL